MYVPQAVGISVRNLKTASARKERRVALSERNRGPLYAAQTKMTGKVFEEFSLREVYLGNVLHIFRAIWPVVCTEKGCPKELGFEVDLEYNGSFHTDSTMEYHGSFH